ncbi:hypothetical protein BDV96DRAFT_506601 [Lophiotrema nucula]|uniref:Hydrophobic surface binding protein A-domain-containing protein n=1 Tax=Lophiotrema nucula TaxID=690887 RepID=A0A6A5YLT7_9PLEO|nr:hypothetical protein BDV96DRAFT_506601 [Lophiotrema nucula]
MKYLILTSLLASAAFAAPLAQKHGGQATQQQGATGQTPQTPAPGSQGTAQTPSPGSQGTPSQADLATAVANWMADTSMVSNFLNVGGSIQNNVAFKQAATVAFNAEVDELNHKAIIDAALGNTANVQAANSTLATGGAFMDVVNKLQIMSQQGMAAVNNIDLILQNRCVNVLPNIDAYMAATGDNQSKAVRPTVCDSTGIAGGVQGQGPTLPGQAPGTPQAAFDAAAALARGQGNGQVQNGGTAGTQTSAGTQTGAGTQAGAGIQAPAGAVPTGAAAQTPQTGAQGQGQTGTAKGHGHKGKGQN